MNHRTRTIVAAALGVALGVILFGYLHGLVGRVQHAEDAATTARAAATANRSATVRAHRAVDALAAQVKRLGGNPVVKPGQVPGPAGATGATGAEGPVGPRGAAGPRGASGAVGPMGAPGATGAKGSNGQNGATGLTGATGAQGPAGPQGAKGDTGDQGPSGPKGDTGPAGYPDQFTFTVGPITYDCTDPDGDHTYDCQPTP